MATTNFQSDEPLLLQAALTYAGYGWRVFPCHTPTNDGCSCRNPRCEHSGKHPRFHQDDLPHGVTNATTDAQQIRLWWTRWPEANIGIATGAESGLVVLDVDPNKGGALALEDLLVVHGALPETVESLTGGGGRHVAFQHQGSEIKNSASKLGAGLDIRGDGGYVIAPPSLHASGCRYEWEASSHPTDVPLAPMPEWLLELVTASQRAHAASNGHDKVGGTIPEGRRNDTLASLAGSMRRRDMTAEEIYAALAVVNAQRCQPPLADGEVRRIAQSIARYEPAAISSTRTSSVPLTGDPATWAFSHVIMHVSAHDLLMQTKDVLHARTVLENADALAQLPPQVYGSVKVTLKELLGETLNRNDLDRAVSSLKKSRMRTIPSARHEDLPPIDIAEGHLRDRSRRAMDALVAKNSPPFVFVRTAALVRVRRDERGRPLIELLRDAAWRGILDRVANFVSGGNDAGPAPVPPPLDVVADLLTLGDWPVPPLEGVTEVPVLRPGGTLLTTPGYDAVTRLLYRPAPGLTLPPIPEHPTARELERAITLLTHELLGDFPFADASSRANGLAALVTPEVRPAIDGPVPLGLVDKPTMGTGASLLVDVIALLATGCPAAMMSAPKDDEEWRKQITAALDMGASLVVIDNVEEPLRAPSLSRALTSLIWKDRRLGRTEMIELPQRACWYATGINISLRGDLARRCYWIRMDARVARPWQRAGFRHPDLLGWVREHRGELVAAVLTVARAWFAAGRPPAEVMTVGGFDAWAKTVGGILAHAGVGGFLANLPALYESMDEEAEQWVAFLETWYRLYEDTPVVIAEALRGFDDATTLMDVLPIVITEGWEASFGSVAKRLGKALSRKAGTVIGDYRLESLKRDTATNATRWRVVKIG
jgi:Bifunctional DNA primase/polymerase, N-terminal/Primase C terminal 1 (PriCT-1)